MVGWIILGVIVALIVAILLIPVGAELSYMGGDFRLSAKAAGIRLQLIPEKPGKEKPAKEKKPKKKKKEKTPEDDEAQEEESSGKKKGLPLGLRPEDLLEMVKAVFRGIGRFRRKLSIDWFLLHLTLAGDDPYATAMNFAYLNEALSILAPLGHQSFRVRNADVRTAVDFVGEQMQVDAELTLTIRIGQIFGVVNSIIYGVLKVVLHRRRLLRKEAKLAKKQKSPALEAGAEIIELPIDTENTQDKERMESNG